MLPNEKCDEDIEYYVRTVDEVEELTGLDFYPALPDDVESIVESQVDIGRWSFRQFSSSSRPDDYQPTDISTSTGSTAKLENAFNTVFYEIKAEVFSILGLSDIAKDFGLL